MKIYYTLFYCIITLMLLCLSSCQTRKNKPQDTILIVSISPLKYIVETITCGDFPVNVLVPDGASPETYSPTANQMMDVESAKLVFTTGLIDFEHELTSKISGNANRIINLSDGITLLSGSCGHSHNANNINHHKHSIDPHIWTSPKQLKVMALNAYKSVHNTFPDSVKYANAYNNLHAKLDSLDNEISNKITNSGKKYFIVYHPALTYYANDYGISQISIEDEGKEPSAIHMQEIARLAKANSINTILYQKQFSRAVVNSIAEDINAEPIEINPLNEQIISEIQRTTEIIIRR